VLDRQDGPAIVAGHSYGGQVMTALGTDAPNVACLVYIAAFGLDQGESLGGLLAQGPVTPALAHLATDERGFGWLPEDDFVHHFAADVAWAVFVGLNLVAMRLRRVWPGFAGGCSRLATLTTSSPSRASPSFLSSPWSVTPSDMIRRAGS
jgi:pimeloyl-ACP methyl ester carboxylesterase